MAHFVLSCSKAFHIECLVPVLFCLLTAVSCDFPPNWGNEKGSLTIVLPGRGAPEQSPAARAVHLPEPVTGNMSYVLAFYVSGESEPALSTDPTQDSVVTVELDPGYWDIEVTAYYGTVINDTAKTALARKTGVEILAGQANSVSFEMSADDFITPDRVEGPLQELSTTTSDTPPLLSVTMNTSTAFTGIDGWTDGFSYQWYWEDDKDADNARHDIPGAAGSFSASGPGAGELSCAVVNSTGGTFWYWVEITNTYTYTPPEGGTPISDSMTRRIRVAKVVVNPTGAAITITWPAAGPLPEAITGNMSYVITLHSSGGPVSIPATREREITRQLEPGDWDIVVTAHYGTVINDTTIAAVGKQPQVEVRAGETTSVSVEMHVDYHITPSRAGTWPWPNQDDIITTIDTRTLSVTMNTSTAFSGISGWIDDFSYQWYYEDGGGNRTDVGPAGSFSASIPGSEILSLTVGPSSLGTYYYYLDITNDYTPPTSTTSFATNFIYVAKVEVASVAYSVGDTGPSGGIVFYKNPSGFISNGVICHYLEAALTDVGPTVWGAYGTSVGGTGAAIGTGYANTQTIVTRFDSLGESGGMARLVYGVSILGNTDWFLPSRDELVALYGCGLTTFVSGLVSPTWSSTELGDYAVWNVGFDIIPNSAFKNISNYFRPVRAFP